MVLSGSMDKTVKLWDAGNLANPVPTGSFAHEGTTYQAVWHPTHESIFGSCAADQMCRIWDLRTGKDVKKIHAHTNDILSIDFNKYENFIATASTDNLIKIFVSQLYPLLSFRFNFNVFLFRTFEQLLTSR